MTLTDLLGVDQAALQQLLETAITGLVTLIAAFAGSWYAFRLADKAKARDTLKEQVAAVNRAQFSLIQQYNNLVLIRREFIDPIRNHGMRAIAMRSLLPLSLGTTGMDFGALSFILETPNRDLLSHLFIEEQRYLVAIQAMNERSKIHIQLVQPRLAAAGIKEGATYPEKQIVEALGDANYLQMQRTTDDAIAQVDETVKTTAALIAEVYRAMKLQFPKHEIIRMKPN